MHFVLLNCILTRGFLRVSTRGFGRILTRGIFTDWPFGKLAGMLIVAAKFWFREEFVHLIECIVFHLRGSESSLYMISCMYFIVFHITDIC